jgi:glycerol uptake facilitator-like aquaporin
MFDLPLIELSLKARSGPSQAFSEWVATFGLMTTILLTRRVKPDAVAMSVGLYITAAYWFTASTSFANPAVTIARALSDTFAGIRPADVGLFCAAEFAGAVCALGLYRLLAELAPVTKAEEAGDKARALRA